MDIHVQIHILVTLTFPTRGMLVGGRLPKPPPDVLRAGERKQFRSAEKLFLVRFCDSRRSWQWLPRSKMAPIGINDTSDRMKLEARSSSMALPSSVSLRRLRVTLSPVAFRSSSWLVLSPLWKTSLL
uniref:Uncharacterized protein n=1 Tax=Oryzias sinensis TaxID=183150 RepID=A0A8C8DFJ8_9TELE